MADDEYSVGSVVILEDEDGDELVAYVEEWGWSGQVFESLGSATLENLLGANPGARVKAVLRGGVFDYRLEVLEALEEGSVIEVVTPQVTTNTFIRYGTRWRHVHTIGTLMTSKEILEWVDAGSREIYVLERKAL